MEREEKGKGEKGEGEKERGKKMQKLRGISQARILWVCNKEGKGKMKHEEGKK